MIVQVCASGGLKRESNSLAPGLKLRRNQAALASPALAQTDRQQHLKPDSPAAFLSPTIDTRAGHARRRFHCVSLSLDQHHYPLLVIGGCCHEDRPSGRWPAIYCCWAFLVRTRDGIAPMATQFSDGRLRRRRRSRRYRPCLVRMAVSCSRSPRITPGGFS